MLSSHLCRQITFPTVQTNSTPVVDNKMKIILRGSVKLFISIIIKIFTKVCFCITIISLMFFSTYVLGMKIVWGSMALQI